MPLTELDRLRFLERLRRASSSSPDLDDLLHRALRDAVEALEAEAGSLWLLDESGQQLSCRAATGPVADQIEGLALPLGAGIAGAVAATRRPEIVADPSADRRFLFQVDQQTGFVTRSIVCAPLLLGDACLGAVEILNSRSPDAGFQREDRELVEAVAATMAQALERDRLRGEERRAEERLALLRLTRELIAAPNAQSMQQLVDAAAALASCEGAALALHAAAGDSFSIAATAGTSDRGLKERAQTVARAGEEQYIADLAAEAAPPFPPTEACRSLLVLPLRAGEGAVGALYLESARRDAFSPAQRELLTLLAEQAGVILHRALTDDRGPWLKRRGWAATDKSRARRWGAFAAIAVALGLLPWQYRVGGPFRFRPATRVEVAARSPGVVRQVLVREGQIVQAGDVVAVLEDRDVERDWTEALARRDLTRQALQLAQAASDASGYRQQLTALAREEATLSLLAERRAAARIRSPLAGTVLTPRLEERIGELLGRGAPFCVVGALDPLEAEIMVPEERVMEVTPGQTILLKLSALPGERFRTRVTRIGAVAQSQAGGTVVPVFGGVANASARFRPGQEGWAKITIGWRPLGYVLFKRAWDWVRLRWWRLW